jgi:hypothetical protein
MPAPSDPAVAPAVPESLWAAVQEAAGGAWPPADAASADRFADQAAREGLLPLLFTSPAPPRVVAESLDRRRGLIRLAEARADLLSRALGVAADLLVAEPFVVMKGADYMWRLYGRPSLRPMQDVDLLVPADRLDAVCTRLRAGGFRDRPPARAARAAPSYYERAFVLGDVVVEVHQSFLHRSRHPVDYAAVWGRRVPLPRLGPSAARLDDVDAIAYHALAMAKDEFTVPLVRYLDLLLMLRAAPGALRPAAGRAREWKASRAMFAALHGLRRLFPGRPETEEIDAVAGTLQGPLARRFLARFVLPPPREQGRAGAVTRRRQLWRKFWLLDDPARRLAFAFEHAVATAGGRRREPPA